jgi:hypothetical protein
MKMAMFTKAHGFVTFVKAMAHLFLSMAAFIAVAGSQTTCKDTVNSFMPAGRYIEENFTMASGAMVKEGKKVSEPLISL